ncbi:hypothetical protein BGZ89_011850 [Linnemannia elongata]|nr:hypothetical protein BGZ89_011850 [Linnemannia elongata]
MKIIISLVLAAASVIATTSSEPLSKRAGPGPHWDYGADKAGPSHWSLLDPAYVICDKGLQQSPVDINADTLSRFVNCASKALTFDYKPLKDVIAHFNGHTVEVDWTPSANAHNNTITIGKKMYNLVQFHFHTPSEHRINGRHADAELHLVHRSPIDQSLAVIGVLLQAQAKNVPFFKYLTALQKKVHDQHPVAHFEEQQQLKDVLSNNPYAFVEDASADSMEFADGDDGDQEFDYEQRGQGEEEEEEKGDDAAEYNAEDETDFSSQEFNTEPVDDNEEDENQVDVNVNMNIVETIVIDTLDKNTNNNNNNNNNNNSNNNNNQQNDKNIKNAQQQPLVVNNNDNNDNTNIDNNQGSQGTNITTTDDALSTAAAAEKCKLPPTVDDIICTGVPPTDEEAIHIELPLKAVDFSPLVKTVKGFTYRWEYSGSLTTPPCSEHVAWSVMHEPFPIGLEQLRALVDLQGYNARMINEDIQSKREPLA